MARQEEDREDLMAEATSLVERASVRLPGRDEETVVGFRREGSFSVYVTPDRVYQFTSNGKLRRAYVDGLLYKARAGELISLRRERHTADVLLISQALSDEAARAFLAEMQEYLQCLADSLSKKSYCCASQFPKTANVLGRVGEWLTTHAATTTIAASPRSN